MLSLIPLLGVLLPALIIVTCVLFEWKTWRRWRGIIAAWLRDAAFTRDDFLKAASLLTWEPMGEKVKNRRLSSLGVL